MNIFFIKKKEWNKFPNIKLKYESPYLISNLILEIDYFSKFEYQRIFEQACLLGNIDIQLKFIFPVEIAKIKEILYATLDKRIRYIEILMPFNIKINSTQILDLLKQNLRVSRIVFIHVKTIRITFSLTTLILQK